jgi:hypothetical protein
LIAVGEPFDDLARPVAHDRGQLAHEAHRHLGLRAALSKTASRSARSEMPTKVASTL